MQLWLVVKVILSSFLLELYFYVSVQVASYLCPVLAFRFLPRMRVGTLSVNSTHGGL